MHLHLLNTQRVDRFEYDMRTPFNLPISYRVWIQNKALIRVLSLVDDENRM